MRRLVFALLTFVVFMQPVLAVTILHRPSDSEPDTLDPQKGTSAEGIVLGRDLFVGLVTLDNDMKPVPGVAESWTMSPDGKLWIFKLRRDAKWSNGEPLTAQDFVYSFRRLVDPKTAAADSSDLDQVVNAKAIVAGTEKDLTKLGVAAPDPYTLTITLTEPRAIFLLLMTDAEVFPLHRASLEKWGDDWTKPGHIVSNGPFRMKAWTPQADIVLEKNPNFFDAATVTLDEVHWIDASDLQAALRRYRAGELDWVRLDRTTIQWARQNDTAELLSVPEDGSYFLFFNMTKGDLAKDIRLRQAINLAIDRETIAKKIDNMGLVPAYGLVTPLIPNFNRHSILSDGKPISDMKMAERLEKAKALTAAAGYSPSNPLKLSLSYSTSEAAKQIMLAVRQMLLPIGIDLTLDNMEWQVLMGRVNQRDFSIGYMGASSTYLDYESDFANYWTGSGNFNWSHYSNPIYDKLFATAMIQTDETQRRALSEQAEAVLLADQPFAPLEFESNNLLVKPTVKGVLGNQRFPQSRYISVTENHQ